MNAKQKVLTIVCLTCVALGPASVAQALPPDPDNAALLYYQGFLMIAELDDAAREHIGKVARGEVAPDDKVREYIQQSRNAIAFVEAAADVPVCDWGLRFSQGFDAQMPQLAQMRFLTHVLAADARVRISDGDFRGAFERCLLMDSISRHVGDDTLISYLVSIAIRAREQKCLEEAIGRAAGDADLLRWLKKELARSGPVSASPVRPMKIEKEIALDALRMENLELLVRLFTGGDPEKRKKILAAATEEIFGQARRIYATRADEAITVLSSSLPYDQSHPRLSELTEEFDPNDPASAAAGALMPALASVLSVRVRDEAQANAISTGIEICLRRARSGQLPAALPAGLPKDPFSGEDFEYRRTDNGFVLRCRGKDLNKDTLHEYAFALK